MKLGDKVRITVPNFYTRDGVLASSDKGNGIVGVRFPGVHTLRYVHRDFVEERTGGA